MLKISKKLIAPFLSYSIFLRGLFFYAAPCIMQLHYLLVVVLSDVKDMSSTVAVIFAITRVVNNYNILTEPHFLNRIAPNSFRTES